MSRNRLCRSPYGKVFGVCQGLADYLRVDVKWIRLGAIIATFVTGGVVVFIYLVLGIFLPVADESGFRRDVSINDIKREFDNLKSRVNKMEDSVFNKEKEWDERFRNS